MLAKKIMAEIAKPPTTSVCMATYNGSKFIQEQIESIVEQSLQVDQIIIVDDASVDDTVSIISAVKDPRIRLIRNKTNRGVIHSFNEAISCASGEIVFLCDQDDVWRRDKVETCIRYFAANPNKSVVISNASVIDAMGHEVRNSWFGGEGFKGGFVRNLVKNRYTGCMMAMRRAEIIDFCPVPASVPMHDMWIGLMNEIYGQTGYIHEPLMSYRRHSNNATKETRAPVARMLGWRLRLAWEIGKKWWSRH
jgi:glycosyltransferase involved in cell wall biosynthesis